MAFRKKAPGHRGFFLFPSGLHVGDAFHSGLGKMLLVPGDRSVGGIDVVLHFAEAMALARVAQEDRLGADVF